MTLIESIKLALQLNNEEIFKRLPNQSLINSNQGNDDTPVGTIIAFMGMTPPEHYLACNGQILNIADYPELAQFFKDQFGKINYFGGNGNTTFMMPDLRGEFLRGTGTNSYARQGSGAAVGIHQNATEHVTIGTTTYKGNTGGQLYIPDIIDATDALNSMWGSYKDSTMNASHYGKPSIDPFKGATVHYSTIYNPSQGTKDNTLFTSRPTNTSVLWCIKYETVLSLSRPDLWPMNTELNLGEGLYGYKGEVDFSLTPSSFANLIIAENFTGIQIISCNGCVTHSTMMSNGIRKYTNTLYAGWSNWMWCPFIDVQNQILYVGAKVTEQDQGTARIWVTYRKDML